MKKPSANPSITIKRCTWCAGDGLYERYHDHEWGRPTYDDQVLFEFLVLESAQAGLSWITVLRKRENYRLAFDHFDPQKVARYNAKKIDSLLTNEGIIRNKLKIESAIRNAKAFLDIQEKHGSFSDYIWQFVEHKPVQNRFRSTTSVPASTPRSDKMSATLKKAGFNFVGTTICYAYMQATGMVNDHLVSCFCHEECRQAGL